MGLPVRHHTILNSIFKSYILVTHYYYYSPLCGVFTIIYLQQTVLLECIVLQLFCSYNLWYINLAERIVLLH